MPRVEVRLVDGWEQAVSGTHGAGKRTWDDVSTIPRPFLDYLKSGIHTGRGTGHQIATTDTIVPALTMMPPIQRLIAADAICYFAGAKHGRGRRNLDLVFGAPGAGAIFDTTVGMLRGIPRLPVASGEYKSIMTELGKNAGNRKDDLRHHATQSHAVYGSRTIAFGVCHVNAADEYWSYTGNRWQRSRPDGLTAAAKAVDTLRDCLAGSKDDRLDVLWTPVVVANNHPDPAERAASWVSGYPQPPDGDELSWGHFIAKLAYQLADRLS